MLEISTVDPQLGGVFYTLSQDAAVRPKFVRQTHECLSCHQSSLTGGVPGLVMRSVYGGRDGLPILSAGTFITTDASPMRERWGGWYVTGMHGEQRHMGNLTARDAQDAGQLDRAAGANVKDLRRFCETSAYPSPHSDIVALMVLAHQAHVHNLITRASFETRRALHYEAALNKELGRPRAQHSDSTLRRIRSGVDPLLRAMLFVDEAPLEAPVHGTSAFAKEFPRAGPRDGQKRSLRDFDLKKRLFRTPCSYLIYSRAFDQLPDLAREQFYRSLWDVLEGRETSAGFKHLSEADRKAIREILLETKPEFAAWKRANG